MTESEGGVKQCMPILTPEELVYICSACQPYDDDLSGEAIPTYVDMRVDAADDPSEWEIDLSSRLWDMNQEQWDSIAEKVRLHNGTDDEPTDQGQSDDGYE